MDADGSNFTELHTFNSSFGNPPLSNARLLAAGGQLFGTAAYGGQHSFGAVFRLNLDGTGFQVLHHFNAANPPDGSTPVSALMLGADGLLYGTTMRGGEYGSGTAFRLNPAGGGFERLHSFMERIRSTANGRSRRWCKSDPPIHGDDNRRRTLQGRRSGRRRHPLQARRQHLACGVPGAACVPELLRKSIGVPSPRWARQRCRQMDIRRELDPGPSGFGTIYAISSNGPNSLLHHFTVSDGGNPWAGLTVGADGSLFGADAGGRYQRRRRAVSPAVRFGWRQRSRPARQLSDGGQSIAGRHRRRWRRRRLSSPTRRRSRRHG